MFMLFIHSFIPFRCSSSTSSFSIPLMSSQREPNEVLSPSLTGSAIPPSPVPLPSSDPSTSPDPVDATYSDTLSSTPGSTTPAQSPEAAPQKYISNKDVRTLFSNPQTEPIIERYYKITRSTFQLCLLGLLLVFFQLSHFDWKEAWYNFRHPVLLQRYSMVPFIVLAAVYFGGMNFRNPLKRFDIALWVHQKGWVIKPPTPSPDVLEKLERRRRAHANIVEAEAEAGSSTASQTRTSIPPAASLLSAAQTAALIAPVPVFNSSFHVLYGFFTFMWVIDLCRHVGQLETVPDADQNFVITTIVFESIMVVIGVLQLVILAILTKRIQAMLDHELLLKQSEADMIDNYNRIQSEEV